MVKKKEEAIISEPEIEVIEEVAEEEAGLEAEVNYIDDVGEVMLSDEAVLNENIKIQLEKVMGSDAYANVSKKQKELVYFELMPSSNKKFQDPQPIRINDMKFSAPRSAEMALPRFAVAAIENHYIVTYANKISPYTKTRKKRKVLERIYEDVRLLPNPETNKISQIDHNRRELLRREIKKFKIEQLKKLA